MKQQARKILSGLLAAILIISQGAAARAAESQSKENHVTFSHLSQMADGESVQHVLTGTDGSEIVVGIKKIPTPARAGGETWQVWYKAIGVDVEFYMTVSNNRVTSVYDYSITLIGASYDDASLTKTSTYGKLTYTYKALAGLAAGTCWLKGTVTGEDDQIEVTWQM